MGELGAAVGHDSRDRQGALASAMTTPSAKEKDLNFNVFVHQKWTPYLMMVTLFNSVSGLNEFADEATYRLSGESGTGRPAEYLADHHAGSERDAGARADAAGRLVGRQVQSSVPAMPSRRRS